MTLYDLYHTIQDVGIQLPTAEIPVMKNGKDVNLDFHIVTDKDGLVSHIEMEEK